MCRQNHRVSVSHGVHLDALFVPDDASRHAAHTARRSVPHHPVRGVLRVWRGYSHIGHRDPRQQVRWCGSLVEAPFLK